MLSRAVLLVSFGLGLAAAGMALALQPPERPRDGVPPKLPTAPSRPSAPPAPTRPADAARPSEGAAGRPSSDAVPGLGPTSGSIKSYSGLGYADGPAVDKEGNLYFCDVANSRIYRLDTAGKAQRIADNTNRAYGLGLKAKGEIVVSESEGAIALYSPQGSRLSVLADRYLGKPLNSPRDLLIDSAGGVYFTDPFFGRPANMKQDKHGVYYMASAGALARLVDDLQLPNGLALSPDEKTLYVVATGKPHVMAYEVTGPGRLGDSRVFCLLQRTAGTTGGGDGCTVDSQGNVYIATLIGVQVYSPQGKLLGVIRVPEVPSGVAFGGRDFSTLYVTARTSVYAFPMLVKGVHAAKS